ncbi:MAG: hypothetical protein ACE5ER_06700 [Nitrospinaceae bacterium]
MQQEVSAAAAPPGKYRQAAWGFLAMNLLYLVVTYLALPPIGLNYLDMMGYTALALILFGALAWGVYKGMRRLTVILAAVYGARAVFSVYTLVAGTAFPIVPWVLPTIVAAFYFLGRAAWDWP